MCDCSGPQISPLEQLQKNMYPTPNTFFREKNKKNISPTGPSKLPQSFRVANPVSLAAHIFASPLRPQSARDPPLSRASIRSHDLFYFATPEFVESYCRGEGCRLRKRYMQPPQPTALSGRRGKTEVGAPGPVAAPPIKGYRPTCCSSMQKFLA